MKKWLLVVVGVAFVLRVVGIGNLPVGFTPDEASFGYDAWSVLTTGRDQWGEKLPLTLKSFGDYKGGLFAYLCLPFVAVLGLTERAVRLPNALLGVAAVVVVYGFVKEWLRSERVALLAGLLLAVSSWHVMLSRGGFEATLVVFFLPLALWAMAKGRRKPGWLYVAVVVAGVSLFSYHSAKLVVLVVMCGFFWWWRKELLRWRRYVMGAGLVLVGFLGLALVEQMGGAGTRASDVSIFNPDDNWAYVAERRYEAVVAGMPDLVARGFWNKAVYGARVFGRNYFSYFSPEFLFTEGPGEGTYGMVPGVGVVYGIELIFLVGFGVALIRKKKWKDWGILILWLGVAVVPAALAKGPGRAANRAAGMMPAWQIMTAMGGVYLLDLVKKEWRKWVVVGFLCVLVLSGVMWGENYVFHAPKRWGASMLYGRREAFEYVRKVEMRYNKVVVSRHLSEPQMFVAFYLKVPPVEFQRASEAWDFESYGVKFLDQMPVYRLGRYEFRRIEWNDDRALSEVLFVGMKDEIPEGRSVVKEVFYPNGEVAIRIAESEGEALAKGGE